MATVSTRHYPQGQFWLWVVGFLAVSVSSEQAAYPRLVSLALAMQFGAKAVTIMFQVILGSILRWIKYLSSDLILRISSVQYNNYLLIYLISSFVFVLFSSLTFYVSPQEFNNYGRAQKPNVLNGVGAGLARCLELESVAALCVAVWGYPQFAAGDQVTTYSY